MQPVGPAPGVPPASFEEDLLAALQPLHRFAMSMARDSVQAEDLVQETYVKALSHRDQFQPGSNCRAWLFTICRNLFLKGRVRQDREAPVEDAKLEALEAAGVYRGVQALDPFGSVFERRELQEAVREALTKLPEDYRLAVTLVDIEDQSYATAAQVLGVPVGTVRSRLFRGRRLLQEDLLAYAQDAGLLTETRESVQ